MRRHRRTRSRNRYRSFVVRSTIGMAKSPVVAAVGELLQLEYGFDQHHPLDLDGTAKQRTQRDRDLGRLKAHYIAGLRPIDIRHANIGDSDARRRQQSKCKVAVDDQFAAGGRADLLRNIGLQGIGRNKPRPDKGSRDQHDEYNNDTDQELAHLLPSPCTYVAGKSPAKSVRQPHCKLVEPRCQIKPLRAAEAPGDHKSA